MYWLLSRGLAEFNTVPEIVKAEKPLPGRLVVRIPKDRKFSWTAPLVWLPGHGEKSSLALIIRVFLSIIAFKFDAVELFLEKIEIYINLSFREQHGFHIVVLIAFHTRNVFCSKLSVRNVVFLGLAHLQGQLLLLGKMCRMEKKNFNHLKYWVFLSVSVVI